MENIYEQTKTLRFGLSVNKDKKNKMHQEFSKLVENSFDKVKKISKEEINKNPIITNEEKFIEEVKEYFIENKIQLELWKEVSQRPDLIKFSKDYLRILARKAKFDFNKKLSLNLNGMINKEKQPLETQKKILNFFVETIDTNEKLLERFEPLLEQFVEALNNQDKAHLKPNKTDFQKQFLSLLRISSEWLNPLRNNGIEIVIKENQKGEDKNKTAVEFESKKNRTTRSNLYDIGQNIKKYIEANGKQVPFAKFTFNYYTAQQKPENVETQITDLIETLEIKKLYEKIKDKSENEIEEYFLNQDFLGNKNKLDFFSKLQFSQNKDVENYLKQEKNITTIELAQVFKPKPIPASVKYALIDRFVKKEKYDREKITTLLEEIGEKVDIANDFAEFKKDNDLYSFLLENYPLKLAFDYAWENLAKNMQSKNSIPDENFAKDQCIEFLKKFGINDPKNHDDFKLYSSLSFIRDELAIVEHKNKNNTQERIDQAVWNIQEEFKKECLINKLKKRSDRKNNYILDKSNILKFINGSENQFFQKSKSSLGLLRGGLKNKVQKYKNLTETFKHIAAFLGRNFADLRDKLQEEYQFNKISHYAVLLEDKNDKYLLALEIDKKNELEEEKRNERLDILENKLQNEKQNKDDIVVKKVSSLTAKTLNKILQNPSGYKDFHSKYNDYKDNLQNIYEYDSSKHMQIIGELKYKLDENGNKIFDKKDQKTGKVFYKKYRDKNNKQLLDYIKVCLTESKMSQSQNWNDKFSWKEELKKCTTYEEIEKVCDILGYCIEEKYISKNDIKNLVENKNCLLLPLINQDISSEKLKNKKFISNKNQFTKDFEESITFKTNTENFRLHPECTLFYKLPAVIPENEQEIEDLQKNHKVKILNRNMRFQVLGNFGIEKKTMVEEKENFVSRKEKLKKIRNKEEYEKSVVKPFNEKINSEIQSEKRKYFYGIDRGIKELATLCVLDHTNEIQDFIVFKKKKCDEEFLGNLGKTLSDEKKKKRGGVYRYTSFEKQSILDLTNIKVETWHMADKTHPNSIFLKKAFEEIKQKPNLKKMMEDLGHDFSPENKHFKILVQYPESEGSTALKLRMKHYQRLLAYSCSHSEKREMMGNIAKEVFENLEKYDDFISKQKEKCIQQLFGLNDKYENDSNKVSIFEELQAVKLQLKEVIKKVGTEKLVLLFDPLLRQFFEWNKEKGTESYTDEKFKEKYAELDDLDNLKRGIVANMLGTINFLMEHKKGVIVLEDVQKEDRKDIRDSLDEHNKISESHSDAEHLQYAGTETYRYLEKMLVRKFEKQGLTPPFADLDSLNKIEFKTDGEKGKKKKQFGIFYYVPANLTSNICPECGFCICENDKQDLLPEFANPKTKEEINEYSQISLQKNSIILEKKQEQKVGLSNLSLIMGIKDNLEIKQIPYIKNNIDEIVKNGNLNKLSKKNKELISDLLIPRLGKRGGRIYQWEYLKKDPFFCAKCGKNTDPKIDGNFEKNFTSADDIAAYNVARSIQYSFFR